MSLKQKSGVETPPQITQDYLRSVSG